MSSRIWPAYSDHLTGALADRQTLLIGLFGIGLTARLLVLAAGHASLQAWEYETIAENILTGHGYVIMHFGRVSFAFGDGNLYSFLAGAVYLLVGHKLLALALVQVLIGSLIGPLLFAIGERPLGTAVAALGGVLGTLHPGLLAYTLKLHPLGLDVVLMAAMVLWMCSSHDRMGVRRGLALGLNLMSRPTFFVAGALALTVQWRTRRTPGRDAVLALAIGLAVALPWVGRNWVVLGQPVFTTTGFEDMWKGNNPSASGSGLLANGTDVFSAAPPALAQHVTALNEVDRNAFFGKEVVEFAYQHPRAFTRLVIEKFLYFWWSSPQTGLLYPSSWLRVYLAYAAAVLAFAAWGAVSIVRTGSADAKSLLCTILTISLSIGVLHALTYVEGRHRWGIEPLLLLLTARGLVVAARSVARAMSDDGAHAVTQKAE